MPWPPTFDTDTPIPIAEQIGDSTSDALSENVVPGIEAGIPLDLGSGVLAPGVMSPEDNPLDRVEQLYQMSRLFAEADATDEDGKISTKRERVIQYVREQLGKPYVWGGTGPSGFDCSGLLWQAFRRAGIDMPRVSMAQAERGKRVALSQLRPGDLVAWENNPRQKGADHIALYIGDGMIIEAPRSGLNVRIRKLTARDKNAWGVQLDY